MPFTGFGDFSDDVIVINEAGPLAPSIVRRGVTARAKQRTSIEIRSEALLFDLDELQLGQKPAEAIRAELSKDNKNITDVASDATLKIRKYAAAHAEQPWVLKRYGGGRTGFKQPNQTVRVANDSGRLADGYFVRENKTDKSYTVNVPANRLDPTTWAGKGFDAWIERFRSLMPILRSTQELLNRPAFNAAVSEAAKDMVTKGELNGDATAVQKLKALAAARKAALRALFRAASEIVAG